MKITADTNVLVRALVDDHPIQAESARSALVAAEVVALSVQALCELVWVLRRGYRRSAAEVAAAIRATVASGNVVTDRASVDAGLAMLDLGGDFADGVIAFEGRGLGAEVFVSFDRRAVQLIASRGAAARLLP